MMAATPTRHVRKPRSPWIAAIAVGVLAGLLVAWMFVARQGGGQRDLPTATMKIGSKTFTLEIARTKSQLETGLMDRKSMPADHGMIFVFDHPQELVFWMKDTLIPLDIIFLAPDGKVVSVRQMKAMDETLINSEGSSQYAIELNLNAASAAGVLPGDRLDIPAPAQATPSTQPATAAATPATAP